MCPKFRKPMLVDKASRDSSSDQRISDIGGRVMPDHIHLFIDADPFHSPTNIVKIFNGYGTEDV